MKTYIILFAFMSSIKLSAQMSEFAPIGAKWWYNFQPIGPLEDLIFESQKDTLIGGLTLRKFTKTIHEYYYGDAYHSAGYELFYQDSGRVYLLDETTDELKDYFDYNAEINDTVKTIALSDFPDLTSEYSQAIITDIRDTIVGGEILKIFQLTNITIVPEDFTFKFTNQVLEKIGPLQQRFPEFINDVVDVPRAEHLKCYEDASGLAKFTAEECEHSVSITDPANTDLLLYPNPANDIIFMQPDWHINRIVFSDIHGRTITYESSNENEKTSISISFLPPGIYFVTIFAEGKIVSTQKIIKR